MRNDTFNIYILYAILILSLPIYLFWGQETIIKLIVGVCSLIFVLKNNLKIAKKESLIFILTTFYIFYSSFPGVEGKWGVLNFAYCSLLYFFLTDKYKSLAFESLRKILSYIFLFGIFAYILVILNVISPIEVIRNEIRNTSYFVYPFFILEDLAYGHSIYEFGLFRFNSIFDEPGYVGTICALFLLCDFDLNKRCNKIFFCTGILSFSLAFWVLFIFTLLIKSKSYKNIAVLSFILLIIHFCFYEILETVIYSRLSFENGHISGDNRIAYNFEKAFDSFWNSNNLLFGMGNVAHQNYPGSSTYKSIIYNHGLFGFLIYLLIFAIIAFRKINKSVLLFWVVFMINIYQRPYSLSLITFVMLYYGIKNNCINGKNINSDTSLQ